MYFLCESLGRWFRADRRNPQPSVPDSLPCGHPQLVAFNSRSKKAAIAPANPLYSNHQDRAQYCLKATRKISSHIPRP